MSQGNNPTDNQWRWNDSDENAGVNAQPDTPGAPGPDSSPRYGQWDPQLAAEQEKAQQAAANPHPDGTFGGGGAYSPWGPTGQLYQGSQPGIIPLRPLRVGDILNGAFSAIRQAPAVMVGLVMLIWAIVTALFTFVTYHFFSELSFNLRLEGAPESGNFGLESPFAEMSTQSLISYAAMGVVTQILTIFLTALCIPAIGYLVRGKRPTVSYVLGVMRSRLKSLLAIVGLLIVAGAVVAGLFTLISYGVILIFEHDSQLPAGAVLSIALLLLLMAGAALFFSIRLSFTFSALILEEIGVFAAIKRSWDLTRGMFFRVLGITILASLLVQLFVSAISGLIGVVMALLMAFSVAIPTVFTVTSGLSMLVSGLAVPFTAAVSCLLYIDARIRKEGLAIALQREAAQA